MARQGQASSTTTDTSTSTTTTLLQNGNGETCLPEIDGTRVVPASARERERTPGNGGRGRGRPRKQKDLSVTKTIRKRDSSQYRWSVVGRDAFNRAQQQVSSTDGPTDSSRRYERGEGGGVT